MSEPTKCRSCNADIIWATTAAGKPAPFDAKPVRVNELKKDLAGVLIASTFDGYVNHFVTCPQSRQWRKT